MLVNYHQIADLFYNAVCVTSSVVSCKFISTAGLKRTRTYASEHTRRPIVFELGLY